MKEQNFKNHGRIVIPFHLVSFLAIFIGLVISIVRLFGNGDCMQNSLFTLVFLLFVSIFWFARSFALRAQDRAIRAEENLRHFALTGKLFDSRITIGQIIALRFADDAEFLELCKKAAETGLSPKEIKMQIKNWKADNYRV